MSGIERVTIARGQAWIRRKDRQLVRVMGMAENYVVVRVKGCIPFLVQVNDLFVQFERSPVYDSSRVRK